MGISGDDLCTEDNTCPLQGCDTGKRPHGYGVIVNIVPPKSCPPGHYSLVNNVPLGQYSLVNIVPLGE